MIPSPDQVTFPLKEHLGFTIEMTEGGNAIATLELDERHHNPNGVAHGAVAFTLMDTAMGAAVWAALEPGRRCTTIEMQTRYHRSVRTGVLSAEATIISAGRSVIHLSAKTTDADGNLIASATSSFAVIEPRDAS